MHPLGRAYVQKKKNKADGRERNGMEWAFERGKMIALELSL
jgi:hypothetical protein